MQTREMWTATKWKVVAGAATLSALGISSLALADQSPSREQEAIKLTDQVQSADANVSVSDLKNIRPMSGSFGDLDSPFDDSNTGDSLTNVSNTGDSLTDDSASVDVIAPAPTTPAPTVPPVVDDSFDSDSASFGSVDSDSGS